MKFRISNYLSQRLLDERILVSQKANSLANRNSRKLLSDPNMSDVLKNTDSEESEDIDLYNESENENELKMTNDEIPVTSSNSLDQKNKNRSEKENQKETFRLRQSLMLNDLDYRMWLFDMERNSISVKKRTKQLREAILSICSHLAFVKYVPLEIHHQLTYWLDDEMLEMGVVNEDSTYLLNLWDEGKVLDVQVPSQWDTTPFRIGVKEDYESVGLTLFIHLVQDEEKGGYIIPPFCHWESWYNHKCTNTSGMTKTDDR